MIGVVWEKVAVVELHVVIAVEFVIILVIVQAKNVLILKMRMIPHVQVQIIAKLWALILLQTQQ